MSEDNTAGGSEAERLLLQDAATALQSSLRFRSQRRKDKVAELAKLQQTKSHDRRVAYLREFEQTTGDADGMIKRFFTGDHFKDHPRHEYMDLQRESRLYEESAALLVDDPVMQSDYRRMRAGVISLPPPTSEEVADGRRQEQYIEMMNDRATLYDASRLWSLEVTRLNDSINANDEEIAAISKAVDGKKHFYDFDWQIENQQRAQELKVMNASDKQKLLMAITRLKTITRDINDKYPDSTTDITLDESSLTAAMDVDEENAGVYAWILGRLVESNSNELTIGTIVFGQFTRDVTPPPQGYIFVGKNVDRDTLNSSLQSEYSNQAAEAVPSQEEKSVNINTVATEEDISVARRDDLRITPFTRLNMSLKAVQGGQRTEVLAYRVSGCSVDGVDGEFLESGKCGRVFKYRNVRGWNLFRFRLSEIPELGIFAESCYEALKGPSMSSILDQRASAAFRDLVDESQGIQAGTVQFKRRFAEMSRAGNRIINMDQTDQLFYNEQLLATIRSKNDQAMLVMLNAMYDSSRAEAAADAAAPVEMPAPSSPQTKEEEEEKASSPASTKMSATAASLEEKIPVKTQVTLSHRINYQTSSSAYPVSQDNVFLHKEAELSSLATRYVEEREEVLFALRIEAERAQRAYLESEGQAGTQAAGGALKGFFEKMDSLREATVKVSECLGAWVRVVAAERRRQGRRVTAKERTAAEKTYSVVIAAKGGALYPQSKAMEGGSVKAFRRGLEPLKSATELQLIGSYRSREDAVLAFEKAYTALPSEKKLSNDIDDSAGKQMIVCTRPCRIHYLIRTQHVPADLPCEECAAKKFSKPYAVVPALKEEPLASWIWKGQNYLEKMWADTDFLADNILLKRAVPDFSFEFNPLLLPSGYFKDVLGSLFLMPTDSLAFLRGKIEQVAAAKRASVLTRKTLTGYEMTGAGYYTTAGPLDLDNKLEELCRSLGEVTFAAQAGTSRLGGPSRDLRHSRSEGQLNIFSSTLDSVLSASSTTREPEPFGHLDGSGAKLSLLSHDRVRRALSILGQAAVLAKESVPVTSESVAFNTLALSRFRAGRARGVASVSRDDTFAGERRDNDDFDDDDATARSSQTENTAATAAAGGADPRDRYTKSVYTEAVYTHRGAKFATGQLRAPVAFREPDMWCRTDKGEFKGISKGRAARSFDFQEQLQAEGAKRNKSRKKCQDSLRHEISRHFVASNIPKINKLIEHAKILKGSVLALDIIQAETYKTSRETTIRRIRLVQKRFRGMVARRRVRALLDALRSAEVRSLAAFNAAIACAHVLVPSVIERSVRQCVLGSTRPLLRLGANMSGHYVIVSLFDGARRLKKPLELCEVCNMRVEGPPAQNWAMRRVPCMCRLIRSTEKWTLRIFDPLSGSSITQRIDISTVRAALVKGREAVATLMGPQQRMDRLVGETFLVLQPLFSQKDVTWDFVMEKSYTMARLKASLEGSALPLLPKVISPSVAGVIDAVEFHNDATAHFELATTRGPVVVTAVDDLQKSSDAAWNWEPLADMRTAHKHARALQHRADVLQQLLGAATETFDSHSDEYSEESLATGLDRCLMEVEDHRVQLLVFLEQLEAADSLITRVMRFSKGGLSDFSSQEGGEAEDRVQSYDDFQDGSAWRGLNNKRKMQMRQGRVVEAFTSRLSGVPGARRSVLQGREALAGSTQWLAQLRASFATIQPRLDYLEIARQASKDSAREALRYYVSTLSLPQKKKNGGMRLQQVPYELVFVRDPLERAKKRWRGAWQLLDRRVLALRPVAVNSGNEHFVLRCVVEILTDITTGYFIINVGQDEMPMEESVQHEDFFLDKADFSDMTSHGMENDILMRPEDVRKLLSKPHNWPATHIERHIKVFKHTSLWLAGRREDEAVAASAAEAATAAAAQTELLRAPTREEAKRATLATPKAGMARSPAPRSPSRSRKTEALPRSPGRPKRSSDAGGGSRTAGTPLLQPTTAEDDASQESAAAVAPPDEATTTTTAEHAEPQTELVISSSSVRVASEYLPPSRRPRSLAAYVQYKCRAAEAASSGSALTTYASRASEKKQTLLDTAARLFEYLRLQPHTGRPCLGLTHFMRRISYSGRYIAKSVWLQDVLAETPAMPMQIYRRPLMLCGRVAVVSAAFTMRSVTVDVLADGMHVAGVFSLHKVMASMQAQPLLLAAFLFEIVSSRFSPDCLAFIARNIDLQLPGQESWGQEWRFSLPAEAPTVRYVTDAADPARYRGPVACKFKFLGGAYFKVAVSVGSTDDLLLQFSRPKDGNFSSHSYQGEPFSIELTWDEVRALATRAVAMPGLLPQRYFGNHDLLHAHHRDALLDLLIDSLRLEPSGSEDFRNQIGLLVSRVRRSALQYNSWCKRRRSPPPFISEAAMEGLAASLERMQSFGWRMDLVPGDQKSKLVRVYSQVWRSLDLERFLGGDDSADASLRRARAMRSKAGAHSTMFPVGVRLRAADTFGHGYSTFWRVNVFSDQHKQLFYLDLSPTSVDNATVEEHLSALEQEAMAAEDASGLLVAQTERCMRCLEQLQDGEEAERALLQRKLIPQLRMAQRQLELLESSLTARRQRMFLAVEDWFAQRRSQLHALLSNLLASAEGSCLTIKGVVEHGRSAADGTPVPRSVLDLQSSGDALGESMADALLRAGAALSPVSISAPSRPHAAAVHQLVSTTNAFGRTASNCAAQGSDPYRDHAAWSLPRRAALEAGHSSVVASQHAGLLITSAPAPCLLDALSFLAYSRLRSSSVRIAVFDAVLPQLPFLAADPTAGSPNPIPVRMSLELLTAHRVVWDAMLRGYSEATDRAALQGTQRSVHDAELRVEASTEALLAIGEGMRCLTAGDGAAATALVSRAAQARRASIVPVDAAPRPEFRNALLGASLQSSPQLPFPALLFCPEGFSGPLACGLFVPADEAAPPVPVYTYAALWPLVAERFLGAAPLRRSLLHSCIVHIPEVGGDRSNPRLERWNNERQPPLRDVSYWESMVVGLRAEHREAETFAGDALIMLRDGELVAAAGWMRERFDEYAPIRELRLQKEGREREYRLQNHLLFRSAVFRVATVFCDNFERMFTYKPQQLPAKVAGGTPDEVALEPPVSAYLCRVLITRYLELRRQTEKALPGLRAEEMTRVAGVLDEAFAVDRGPALGASDDELLRFDALHPAEQMFDVAGMLRYRYRGSVRGQNRPDLRPRVGQVVYAMHLVHCLRCADPPHLCKFPGCALVRGVAAPQLEEMGPERAAALLHSGEHPVELAVKTYLLSGRDYHKNTLQALYREPQTGSPEEEQEEEREQDAADLAHRQELENLCLHWREVLMDNRLYRYLYRSIVRSSLGGVIGITDLAGVRGLARGDAIAVEAGAEEHRLRQEAAAAANSPNLLRPICERGAAPDTMQLVEIPRLLAQHMLGGRRGRDCRGSDVPFDLIDPYPRSEGAIQGPPMARGMFEWIASHLSIARPLRQPQPASGDRGQLSSSKMGLKLDRLHCECSNILMDGSSVVIVVLHGVIEGASLSTDVVSGVPPGAVRFCPTHLLDRVRPGLTVVVYDLQSDITATVRIQSNMVKRVAEAFDCAEDDFPRIAQELLRTSYSVLKLSRIGNTCTGASLDLNCICEPIKVGRRAKEQPAEAPRVMDMGRRRSVMDVRAARLAAAMRMANTKYTDI